MLTVDLNCDMGEGCGNDAELMDYISSTNIACGFHAGDLSTMNKTVELAVAKNVAIGAHPGYRDRENFGRTSMSLPAREVVQIVVEQIEALAEICSSHGTSLHHVKPHGALYNQAAKDKELAAAIAEAVATVDPDLVLFGLSGSLSISEAQRAGLRSASEVFADRTYQSDGSLTPRRESNALIENPDDAVEQAMQMIELGSVIAVDGTTVPIKADTLCIHGDGANAVEFARTIAQAFASRGIQVRSL